MGVNGIEPAVALSSELSPLISVLLLANHSPTWDDRALGPHHQPGQSFTAASPLLCCMSPRRPLGSPAVTVCRFEPLPSCSEFPLKEEVSPTTSFLFTEISLFALSMSFESHFRVFLDPENTLPSLSSPCCYSPAFVH